MKASTEKVIDLFIQKLCQRIILTEQDTMVMREVMEELIEQNLGSFSHMITRNKEEPNLDDPYFAGDAYDKKLDQKPFKKKMLQVFDYMMKANAKHDDGIGWVTVFEIRDATGVCEVSVTTLIRAMRKEQWGKHKTPKRRMPGTRTWQYCLIPNKGSLSYQRYMESGSIY